MNCPRCTRLMINLGNVSGIVYESYPPQWDETHVCHICKVKMKVRVQEIQTLFPYTDYEEILPEYQNVLL